MRISSQVALSEYFYSVPTSLETFRNVPRGTLDAMSSWRLRGVSWRGRLRAWILSRSFGMSACLIVNYARGAIFPGSATVGLQKVVTHSFAQVLVRYV